MKNKKNTLPEKKLKKRKAIIKLLNIGLDEETKKKRDAFMGEYRKKYSKKHNTEDVLDIE